MTATAFIDDPILNPASVPAEVLNLVPAPGPAAGRVATATAPRTSGAHSGLGQESWLNSGVTCSPMQPTRGVGRVGVGVVQLDPMVEIYRRRRFALALALTAAILVVTQLLGIGLTSFGPAHQGDESAPLVHVVKPGDTYPAIAASLGADDPIAAAGEIRAANGSADLVIGQRLVLDIDALEGFG